MTVRRYLTNSCLALLYAAMYLGCYVGFLNYYFEYVGFDLYPRDGIFIALSVIVSVLPILLYRGVRAVSSVISVLIYFIVYVPIILTFALGSGRSLPEIVAVQLTFMAGMSLLFLADVIIVKNPLRLDTRVNLMPAVLVLTVAATLYVLVVYRGNLNFASFGEDLYVQRFANLDVGSGLVTRYLSAWLSTVLVPLCFAYGLTTKQYRYLGAAVTACVIVYMAAANKIMILLPFVYLTFYGVLRNTLPAIYPRLSGALSLGIAVLVAIGSLGGVPFVISALVLFRTIGNGGQLTMAYYDFFSFYPHTNYSHVNGLNLFTPPYPYGDLAVGQVVGQFYWSPFMNANAHFWATDGIAAMGLPGVAIASAGCALLFMLINSVTRAYNTLFVVLCFIPFMITLLNQSLFSSLWSGGAFFLLLFFLFNKRSATLMRPTTVATLQVAGA